MLKIRWGGQFDAGAVTEINYWLFRPVVGVSLGDRWLDDDFRTTLPQHIWIPRSGVITTSNQDDFFHPLDSQSEPSGECEPAIDIFNHPPAKITLSQSVFTSSIYREG